MARRTDLIYKSPRFDDGMTWVEAYGMYTHNGRLSLTQIAICQGIDDNDPSMIFFKPDEAVHLIGAVHIAELKCKEEKENNDRSRMQGN